MKLLTEKTTNILKYIFEDTDTVIIQDHQIITDNFIIGDMSSSNSTLYENVTTTIPNDYIGCKYFYDGTSFSANPDYVEPTFETDSPSAS